MKTIFNSGRNPLLKVFLGLSILISTQGLVKASEEDFVLTIQNIVQTATNVLEFDVSNTFLTVKPDVNANVPENPAFTQPVISNSAGGNIEEIYFAKNIPTTQYIVTAMNLTDNLIITAFSTTTLPMECQLKVSLSPTDGFTDQISISPINGGVYDTIYVKPACSVVPFWCRGTIVHTSEGATPDSISVYLENFYYLQSAPIVSIGQVQAAPESIAYMPLFAVNFNRIGAAQYYIDYDPDVLTFVGLDNINSHLPDEICYICPPYCTGQYIGVCNTSGPDTSYSRLFLNIYYEASQTDVPDGEKLFDLVFNYSDGFSDLEFTDGEYYSNTNSGGFDHPEIIDEPFEDYYLNGSVGPLLPKTINLTLNLEGLYNIATGSMNQASGRDFPANSADEISIGFAQRTFPYSIVYEIDSVLLDRSGVCQLEIPGNISGEKYIVVKHRNSIETWSANPLSFDGTDIIYDFTTGANKAFGNNMKLFGSKYCLFGGDANQDGVVDTGDMTPVDNDASVYVTGYVPSDINGDGTVDTWDMTIIDNNASGYVRADYPAILIPGLTTNTVSEITGNTALCGGNITNDGCIPVTERGVCWSTSQNPTISDYHTNNGSGLGTFVSNLTALHLATTYYVRAYASNINATAYGNEVSFTTAASSEFICGTTSLSDIDGNIYNTVLIGDQCWMKENLKTGIILNGFIIASNNGIIEKYCYQDNPANCEIYGGLYKWTEMMQYGYSQGLQGICPDGWHIPSDNEWSVLVNLLGGDGVAGGSLKETGIAHWNFPNTSATDSSGFSGLPGGYRWPEGSFLASNLNGGWWSSTAGNNYAFGSAFKRSLIFDGVAVTRSEIHQDIGCSLRCLRSSTGTATVITSGISDVLAYTASGGGNVTHDGGEAVTARGVCWSTSSNPTIDDSHTCDGTGIGSFISEITGLTPLTNYYVRAYAINSAGTAYGEEHNFSTYTTIPTVTTSPVTWITGSSAITGGNIINSGAASVTSRGVCWSTSPFPTLVDNHTSDDSGTGTFDSYVTGLNFSTNYFIRAYASNSEGTAYGDQMSFTTLDDITCNGFTLIHSEGSVAPVTKTITYNVIITGLSGETKCWITQNLGADRQALSATDDTEESAGWYWQFNRPQGFKHDGTNRTPNTTWISSINENSGWLCANDPCNLLLGSGWRIPTKTELNNALISDDWDNYNEAFGSMLRLHNAGFLGIDDGLLYNRGTAGSCGSSSQYNSTYGWFLNFNNYGSSIAHYLLKVNGLTLRCLRD